MEGRRSRIEGIEDGVQSYALVRKGVFRKVGSGGGYIGWIVQEYRGRAKQEVGGRWQ